MHLPADHVKSSWTLSNLCGVAGGLKRLASVFALAFALLSLAPVAQAAAPGNDDFANAESLGIGLPVDITRTNVEATREMDEPWHGVFGSMETVWFTWEAENTGFVTVSACDSEGFATVLAVYTGTTLGSLVKAVDGNADEGPDCMYSGREFSFEAVGGTSYKVVVAGNGFYLPPGPQPVTSGEFDLRIEATPPPANDDFQDAVTLEGEVEEEPGGDRFYFASDLGYNWLATKETGEPNHGADEGGASVWYSWTPPESGLARITAGCCWPPMSVGLYEGTSMNGLTPVAPSNEPPLGTVFQVSGGTTYRIAVDGRFDSGAGEVKTGSFSIWASMVLPPKPTVVIDRWGDLLSTPRDVRDLVPPQTSASKRVLKRESPVVVVNFSSSEPGSSFRCKLDKRAYSACRSPKRLKNLSPGRHTFRVVATDAAGNADRTPAKVGFRIPERQR